jgi:hypothetical protein
MKKCVRNCGKDAIVKDKHLGEICADCWIEKWKITKASDQQPKKGNRSPHRLR